MMMVHRQHRASLVWQLLCNSCLLTTEETPEVKAMTELVAKLSLADERAPTAATIAKTFKDGGAKALKVCCVHHQGCARSTCCMRGILKHAFWVINPSRRECMHVGHACPSS